MDVIHKYNFKKKIKTLLVFFCVFTFLNCQEKTISNEVLVNYKEKRAVSISITSNSSLEELNVFLKESETPIIGDFSKSKNGKIDFTPVIPFTYNEEYELKDINDNNIASFTIDNPYNKTNPELLAIFPTTDTVPENLLKMYFLFSQPMQEVGNTLDFIKITNNTTSKEVTAFLKLENELWNKEHTQLTLWLDPGRLKTDLIPNKNMGLPLNNGSKYTITISNLMRNANGIMLSQEYSKSIYVTHRDNNKPTIENWSINNVKPLTLEPLLIHFNETLDAILLRECINIYLNENLIEGKFELKNNEKSISFLPNIKWKTGNYTIYIATKLEDLAGNNLNHLFDRDLSKGISKKVDITTKIINFKIN
ncbi:hypothetical protein [Urechidicola croceus]|uniref:SbsA Ig-like domain-containing protein n=1 Tax=Urechidicola croceus TaxID=1850246 RepID=A0A1D8P594_9FLAO|nr:hypothetical protein [Urechidicola croceus]AOW19740.1 hypothetical protein LPB138_03160 [Urechidicola croceus]